MQTHYKIHRTNHWLNYIIIGILIGMTTACQSDKISYCIKGKLPNDSYDGEWIYLAPLTNATTQTIDSVRIRGTQFEFKGKEEAMKVIRMRMALRHKFEELLVITEPGTIRVLVDSISRGMGTPQNEELQQWKEDKRQYDENAQQLFKQLKSCSSISDSTLILAQLDTLKSHFRDQNVLLLVRNQNNTLANFLTPFIEPSLTPQQREQLK